jgi:MFS family permease
MSVPPAAEEDSVSNPAGRSTPYIFRALKHRNYRLFFSGQLVSLIGTLLTMTATSWLVLRMTGSAWMLGVVAFAGQIAMFVLAPFAGVWVDRLNRQKLLVATQTLSMLQSFALAVLALSHRITVGEIIGLSFFQGVVNSFDMPGRQAFLVEMVSDREDLSNAIALNSTMVHTARLLGPAIAGLLIAFVGEGLCFAVDGFSYLGVIAAFLMMRVAARPPKPRLSVLSELKEGFLFIWRFLPIRVLLIVMAAISLTGMPALSVLLPIFADHFAGVGAKGAQVFGMLASSAGLGALVGSIYLANRKTVLGLGRLISRAAVVFGVALIGLALAPRLWMCLLIVPLAGWGMITIFASSNTILQTLSDDDKRGRVMGFFSMCFIGMTPFGNLLAGELATRLAPLHAAPVLGASRTLVVEACVCLLAAGALMWMLPRLRQAVREVYVKKGILPAPAAVEAEISTAAPPSAAAAAVAADMALKE